MDTKPYEILYNYPEFKLKKVEYKYRYWFELDAGTSEGEYRMPEWVFEPKLGFEFILLAYSPDSKYASVKDLRERKQLALEDSKIPESQWERILANENPMIGDMATRLFREIGDFDYELLLSAKEAIETLLEVVRKPIDTRLQDDKERNAVKAKRECFDDAKFLMGEIRKMLRDIRDENPDVADSVTKSVFEGGIAERLIKKQKKS